MKTYYIYILSNPGRTVLYIGMTNNLERRIGEHKSHSIPGFTAKYNCVELLYFEETDNPMTAIEREKQLKGWTRVKKLNLIAQLNPRLQDLSTSSR